MNKCANCKLCNELYRSIIYELVWSPGEDKFRLSQLAKLYRGTILHQTYFDETPLKKQTG